MPHVSIRHFPADLSEEQEAGLVTAMVGAVRDAFGCDEGVISISLEAVEPDAWNAEVYVPEIVERRHLLRKVPDYRPQATTHHERPPTMSDHRPAAAGRPGGGEEETRRP